MENVWYLPPGHWIDSLRLYYIWSDAHFPVGSVGASASSFPTSFFMQPRLAFGQVSGSVAAWLLDRLQARSLPEVSTSQLISIASSGGFA